MAIPFRRGGGRRSRRASLDLPQPSHVRQLLLYYKRLTDCLQVALGDLSLSSQVMYLALVEAWRLLRSPDNQGVQELQEEGGQEEESETSSCSETDEEMGQMYRRLNVSRRLSLPANMTHGERRGMGKGEGGGGW